MKIINVVGARPQFIKYYPIAEAVKAFREKGTPVTEVLIHTGQHYDYSMSKIFFDEFGIKEPEYHLGAGSGSHGDQTALMLKKSEEVFMEESPDVVMVYGDTNSTVAAALAAAKVHIPVVHIEAGLRSFNKRMPEEVNRILTDHISTVLFCPSRTAIDNLRNEGFKRVLNEGAIVPSDISLPEGTDVNSPVVVNVGDVMYDVLLHASRIAREKSTMLKDLGLKEKDYLMLTVHRAESTDDPETFAGIIEFVNREAGEKQVIFPMHPRTRKAYEASPVKFSSNIRIIDPVGYFDVLSLIGNARMVMTDSGGMQKEAYWLKTPCVTLRDRTEWVETVESGWNVLYNDYKGGHIPHEKEPYHYGDGRAAERIVAASLKIGPLKGC